MIKHYKELEKKQSILAKKLAKELEKQKVKEEKQKAKDKAKEEKQKAKDKAKEEKQKAKKPAKTLKKNSIMSENVVLSTETQIGCVQILKTGPNKGKPCGCKIFSVNTCKRHAPKNQN